MASRVLIVGGGALGGVMAARLSGSGQDVTVLDANEEHVRLMRSPGLDVDLVGERRVVPLDAVTSADALEGTFDFGLVTLKAPFIKPALAPLAQAGLVETFVSLGNGLVQDRIADVVGGDRLLAGTVSWGATNYGPGRVAQTTIAPFSLGELDESMSERLRALGDVLSHVAEVHFTDNIQGQIWSKLLLNSTFSGLGVVTGLVYGDVMALPHGPTVAMSLWTEGFKVAQVQGVALDVVAGIEPRDIAVLEASDVETSQDAIARLLASLGPTKASMLQDVEKGAVTEVDVINGGVSTSARALGLATPLNDAVVELVHGYEAGTGSPSIDKIDGLVAVARSELPTSPSDVVNVDPLQEPSSLDPCIALAQESSGSN